MQQDTNRREFLRRTGFAAMGGALIGMAEKTPAAVEMPTIRIGSLAVSRLIIGGNPFSGHAHQPGNVGRQMTDWYTVERIKSTLEQAADVGVNTFLGRADQHIMRMLQEYWNGEGRIRNWIAQSAPEFADMSRNIREVAECGGKGMYIQGAHTDKLFKAGKLDAVRPWLDEIRERGMLVGVGSHRPDVLLLIQDKGWPVDFYMQCCYNLSDRDEEYLAEDREKAFATIRQLEKPVIAFKILAAGRNNSEESFQCAFKNIKNTDAVCVGFFMKDRPYEMQQDAELTRKYGRTG
ncbi:MAG TPA: hypothetical protein PLZ55_02170 [bacterium]|nr:hypothetical protein [bacterium]